MAFFVTLIITARIVTAQIVTARQILIADATVDNLA